WAHWANGGQKFLPSLLFFFVATIICWSLLPKTLAEASPVMAESFWKSLFAGILVSVVSLISFRVIFMANVLWPMGIFLVGGFQLCIVLGLALATGVAGHNLASVMHLSQWALM